MKCDSRRPDGRQMDRQKRRLKYLFRSMYLLGPFFTFFTLMSFNQLCIFIFCFFNKIQIKSWTYFFPFTNYKALAKKYISQYWNQCPVWFECYILKILKFFWAFLLFTTFFFIKIQT